MRKFVFVCFVFSIISFSGHLYAQDKGAELLVKGTDGHQTEGELIAVKKDSLLMQDRRSFAAVTVNVDDIETVRIMKESKIGKSAALGLVMGGLVGAMLGALTAPEDSWFGPGLHSVCWGACGAGAGALFGGISGAVEGEDELLRFKGMYPSTIESHLEKLRKKARVPDYQ